MSSVVRYLLAGGAVAGVAVLIGVTFGWSIALACGAGAGLFGLITFIALYTGRSQWRSRPEGVVLLGDKLVLAALFLMLFVGRLVGGLGLVIWAVAISVFAALAWRWVVVLLKAQARDQRPD